MFTFIEETPNVFQKYSFNSVNGLFTTIITSILNNINLRVCLFEKTTCKNILLINNPKVLIIIKNNGEIGCLNFTKYNKLFIIIEGL